MTVKETSQLISEIEAKFDVGAIEYKGFKAWPLIRFEIQRMLLSGIKETVFVPALTNSPVFFFQRLKNYLSGIYWIEKNYFEELKKENALLKSQNYMAFPDSPVDFLVYGISSHRYEKVGGRYFNRITDSIQIFLGKAGSCMQLESVFSELKAPAYHPTFVINRSLLKSLRAQDHALNLAKLFSGPTKANTELVALNHFLDSLEVFLEKKIILHLEFFIGKFEKIISCKEYFKKIFENCNPKLFFIDIFYHDRAFGAILAAKEKKIPVIEMQHGVQGEDNGPHSNWKNLPASGYELLPDYFWVWDKEDADLIRKWTGNNLHHQVIFGGSPFLSLWKNAYFKNKGFEDQPLTIDPSRRTILFTLQPVLEAEKALMQEVLYPFMKEFETKYNWVFRVHPEYEQHRLSLSADLQKAGIDVQKMNIHSAKEISLYSLLEKTDIHISLSSTVCMEAQSFGVLNILISENGYNFFRTYCDEKIFLFARSKEELKKFVLNESNYRKPVKIIEDDGDIINGAIRGLIGFSEKVKSEK